MTEIQNFRAVPLAGDFGSVEEQICTASNIALFLDFDGTISRIVPHPGDAEMDSEIRAVLERIAARADFTVALVSGRALSDIRERAGLNNVIYVGNHGLEIEAGETRFREPEAEALRRELKSVSLQLKLALADIEGLEIEDKGLTLSVHFRRVNQELHDWISKVAFDSVERSRSFVARMGNKVVEVRPQVSWNKGHALKWICQEVLPAAALPIYIGDDATDEDAFAAIPEGITIKVGKEGCATEAQYILPDVSAVGRFLTWLGTTKPHHASFANAQRAGR
jgi:trehalose 6-phosphate phosphatase